MKLSQYFLPALKESPADAELISHQLMLRAGMIRKLASGIYSWLPLGLRVLQKVESVVREEMNNIGAQEVLLPSVQPAELWRESARWDQYGNELLRFGDRHERDFCYGPTHEEVVTDIMRGELRSYKQLPLTLYQIQTKFRDEIRPRFGVMRGREFIMKDAYSFHLDHASLASTYDDMFSAYSKIFTRLGLNFRSVLADTGSIGGEHSHEFQVLAQSGEDIIAYSDEGDYAANIERAVAHEPTEQGEKASDGSALSIEKFSTHGVATIADLHEKFAVEPSNGIKTLIVLGEHEPLVALILRGDHELNEIKAEKLAAVRAPLTFATEEQVEEAVGAAVGSLGPVALSLPCIVDRDASVLKSFVCGANETGYHFKNVNWERDCQVAEITDLRCVVEGDRSPDGKGHLKFARGIEVGHIFQLGDKYSKAMNMTVLDEKGNAVVPLMGCYGIGVSRIVAAAVEQHHDDRGIVWPQALSPFDVALVPLQMHKSYRVKELAEQLYAELQQAGFSVLMDDRRERPGVMFSTMDLIGISHRVVIGERGIDKHSVEYKARDQDESCMWNIDQVINNLNNIFNKGSE